MILVLVTVVALVLLAMQDIKERMIYTAPIIVLYFTWSVYLLLTNRNIANYLAIVWIMHLVIYIVLNRWNIWGAGDSDMFMLFGNICLYATATIDGISMVIQECIYLSLGLSLSIIISYIERKMKHGTQKSNKDIAVIPGVAIVMIGLMIKGMYGRGM